MKLFPKKITYQVPHVEYYREHTENLLEDFFGDKKSYTKEEILEIAEHLTVAVAADIYLETAYPNVSAGKTSIDLSNTVTYSELQQF